MKIHIRHIIYAIILLIFSVSCIKKDFKQVSTDVTFNPTYSLPIGRITNNIYDFTGRDVFDCNADTSAYPDYIRFIESDGCYIDSINYISTISDSTSKTFDFSTIEEEIQHAKSIMFVINYKSNFPCPARVSANFQNIYRQTVFSLFDPPGLLIFPDKDNKTTVELTEGEIELLPDVRYIQIITTIDISELNQRIIVFNSEDVIDVQIGLKAELEISTDNLL